MAKAPRAQRSIDRARVPRTLACQESNERDESDRTCRRRCRFFSSEPLFRSRAQDRHLQCEPMNDSSLGQLILCGVPGKELDAASAEMFRRVQPGGFILFGRNIESAPQLRKLIDDLRDLSAVEPIITIDQEGGRVSRLRLIGSEPPNAQQLRDKDDLDLIARHGDVTGRLLRVFGYNLDLCPVLDISFDDNADNSLRGRVTAKRSLKLCATPARSMMRCENRGSRAVANIFPATPARDRTRISNYRGSTGRAKS